MVRDRLAEFKKKAGLNETDQEQAMVIITSSDMEQFIEKVENIKNVTEEMEDLIKEMKDCHSKILSSTKQDDKVKKALEDININFKMLSKKTKENLKSIEIDCLAQKDQNSTAYRMRKVQFQTLRQKLLDVINKYNSAQVDYRTKCKELLRRQIAITNQNIENDKLDQILDNPSSEIFIHGHFTETREAREQLEEIQARHADILKIEKSIRELHGMFLEMATLVENQGEMINRIENHVQETHEYVEKGREQTKQAMEYQTKTRKFKIYIAIILIVLVLLIVWASFY